MLINNIIGIIYYNSSFVVGSLCLRHAIPMHNSKKMKRTKQNWIKIT